MQQQRSGVTFSLDGMQELLRCSLRHHLNSIRKPTPAEQEEMLLEQAVRSAILYYFKSLQEGKPVTIQDALDFFGKRWYGEIKRREEILYSHTLRRKIPAANEAGIWIHAFLRGYERRPVRPILVDEPYETKISWHTIRGRFDLVQEVPGDRPSIEIVHLSFNKTAPKDFYLRTHMGLTVASYAFRTIYRRRENALVFAWLRGGGTYTTYRTPADYKRLRAQARQAAWYAREDPMPRFGAHCISCPHQDACLSWTDKGGDDE